MTVPVQAMRESSHGMLAASSRFGRYKEEGKQTVRDFHVKANPAQEGIMRTWETFRKVDMWNKHMKEAEEKNFDDFVYEFALSSIDGLDYSSGDVSAFCIALADRRGRSPNHEGLFLSALINNGTESMYEIVTTHLTRPFFERLGHRNTKTLSIDGECGSYIGHCMEKGTILVRCPSLESMDIGIGFSGGLLVIDGNAINPFGVCMEGGELVLNGNAMSTVGSQMRDGKIVINGDIKSRVGDNMSGGEIHINGDFMGRDFLTGNIEHGKIFHKGKLIVDK